MPYFAYGVLETTQFLTMQLFLNFRSEGTLLLTKLLIFLAMFEGHLVIGFSNYWELVSNSFSCILFSLYRFPFVILFSLLELVLMLD